MILVASNFVVITIVAVFAFDDFVWRMILELIGFGTSLLFNEMAE
jgi:hypothetical protein